MAPREVTADDVPAGNFTKMKDVFQKKGDKFTALYEKDEPCQAFQGTDYTWQLKDGSLTVMSVTGQLEKMLAKAQPASGEKVTIVLTDLVSPTPQQLAKDPNWSSKRIFGLKVDDPPKGFKSALQADEPEPEEPENTDDSAW